MTNLLGIYISTCHVRLPSSSLTRIFIAWKLRMTHDPRERSGKGNGLSLKDSNGRRTKKAGIGTMDFQFPAGGEDRTANMAFTFHHRLEGHQTYEAELI